MASLEEGGKKRVTSGPTVTLEAHRKLARLGLATGPASGSDHTLQLADMLTTEFF